MTISGRMLERARVIPFIETLRSGLDKVQGALPARRQREVEHLASTLLWFGVPARAAPAKVRSVVEQAWLQ